MIVCYIAVELLLGVIGDTLPCMGRSLTEKLRVVHILLVSKGMVRPLHKFLYVAEKRFCYGFQIYTMVFIIVMRRGHYVRT